MTLCPVRPDVAAPAHEILQESDGRDGTLLDVSGWTLHRRRQRNGRTVIEIADDYGDLVGLITSARLPMLSVDSAWRGRGYDVSGTRQWWALAMGHASVKDEDPVVTFTRRIRARGYPHRTAVRPQRLDGLWVAAIPGLYTAVSCRQGTELRIRRLAPTPYAGQSRAAAGTVNQARVDH
jgi:hypothetical protein